MHPAATSVDSAEIARFTAMAAEWWDPHGRFRPLHRLNPLRIGYIRDAIAARHGRDPLAHRPLHGLRLVDIGCGGGLLAEPMARLGAEVVGIDAGAATVRTAAVHAAEAGLTIDYRTDTAEALAAAGDRFDAVLAMEIVEHVADRAPFLAALAELVKPDGLLFMSTLNRTAKAFALAVVGAEYVLGWLPRGTHDWRKFLRPSELAAELRTCGMAVRDLTGIVYEPWSDRFRLDAGDIAVNYMLRADKSR